MKISTIISNYNYAQFLPQSIESVLNQTYRDLELIVVDDGSTDGSSEVVARYISSDPGRIRLIRQENQGQGAALNSGFAVSRGELVAFLDADDAWWPTKLESVVAEFRDSRIVGVMHGFDYIDNQGTIINDLPCIGVVPEGDLAKLIVNTGGAWCYVATSGLTYRRTVLESILPMDVSKWRLCADGVLVYSTAFFGRIRALPTPLAGYRIHGGNNHHGKKMTQERAEQTQQDVEMTNAYINAFLLKKGIPKYVDLQKNLFYRRDRFYRASKWDLREMVAICRLILCWPLYSSREKAVYLIRFLAKTFLDGCKRLKSAVLKTRHREANTL